MTIPNYIIRDIKEQRSLNPIHSVAEETAYLKKANLQMEKLLFAIASMRDEELSTLATHGIYRNDIETAINAGAIARYRTTAAEKKENKFEW